MRLISPLLANESIFLNPQQRRRGGALQKWRCRGCCYASYFQWRLLQRRGMPTRWQMPSERGAGRPATSPAVRGGGPATKEDETVARLGRWVLSNWASAWSIQRFDISEPNRSDRSCPHDLHPTVQMTPDPDGK